jgi:hypothetical protein
MREDKEELVSAKFCERERWMNPSEEGDAVRMRVLQERRDFQTAIAHVPMIQLLDAQSYLDCLRKGRDVLLTLGLQCPALRFQDSASGVLSPDYFGQ